MGNHLQHNLRVPQLRVPQLRVPPVPRFGGPGKQSSTALALCAPLLLALSACKPVGPNYSKPSMTAPAAYEEAAPSPENPAGGSWSAATPSDGMLRGKWWDIYNDPQLNSLEEKIATNNQDLRQATEIYFSARDQVTATRAGLFPTVSGSVSASRYEYSQNRPSASATTHSNDYVLGAQASWEPDFWGRVRRSIESASATTQATAADLATLDLSLHAELAADYFQLRGLDASSKLLTQTVSTLEDQLKLTQTRLAGGIGTEADVAQARTQLETVRAQLVEFGVARAQFEHAMATLTNQPAANFKLEPNPLDLALPKVPVGVPSQLLERRPDIAAAERRTAAANAQIGIAQSAFYPNIPLTAAGGFESVNVGTWLTGPSALWSLGAQATELLFDAGKRRALTDASRHNYEAQAAAYRSTVLAAFNGVEDQLSTLRVLEQESTVEDRAVASAQNSFNLSNQRYKGGVTSYLEVLTAETTLLNNQSTAINLKTRQFVASVGLVRTLGGGWDTTQLPK